MTATSFEIVEEWAGHYANPSLNSDKVWAGCYTADGHYLAVWGRRSTTYQSQSKRFPTAAAAARWFRTRRDAKRGKGYAAVPFGDPRHGAIPSCTTGGPVGAAGAPPAARITLDGVLAELAAVPGRLHRASASHLPDVILAFTQTRLKAELLLDSGRLDAPAGQACLAALDSARAADGRALTS